MLYLATGTVVNGTYANVPAEPIHRLVQAENSAEARSKFVCAMKLDLGETAYLLKESVKVTETVF